MIGGEGGDGCRVVDDENQRETKGEKGKRVRRLKHLKRKQGKRIRLR